MINIALAYDFELLSQQLIDQALPLAEKLEAKVFLIHIAAPDPHLLSFQIGRFKALRARQAELNAERRIMQKIAELFHRKGIDTEVILREGATAEALIEEVQKIKADYLLVGHHRDKGPFKRIFSSSARSLLDKAEIPLMIVPLKD